MPNRRPNHGGDLIWAAQVAGCSPPDLLDFSASISPLGPPASAIAAIQAHLGDISRYPNPSYGQLRQALAAHHQVPADWIMVGNGAAELLTWAGRDLAHQTATYLITPAFGDYGRSLHAFDAKTIACPLPLTGAEISPGDWQHCLEAQADRDLSQCGLLLNTPHNPTGYVIPPAVITQWLTQFGLVVIDEAFMDFLPPQQQTSLIHRVADCANLVVVRSLTKFYSLPGLRLGYGIAQPERLARWQSWRDPWPVNALAEAAAIASLQDQAYQTASWQWLAATRPRLQTALAGLPGLDPLPGQANYLLVRTAKSAMALQRVLLQRHRILIRDCLSFAELGDRYFRVAVRTAAENERLVDALADALTVLG
ncbi:MAG: threonine-phosphate decarboxylase [Leptolyngbya sp. RL_3_1]|nr:threonine-phosphate decarboxylase [Leptolyngbya sp. RL_3_1]